MILFFIFSPHSLILENCYALFMTQIIGNKWDNLPNEILAHIIQALVDSRDVFGWQYKHWAMVNKQWYEWYQSMKYKSIYIRLVLSNRIFGNIINSKLQPGKCVRSITLLDLSTISNIEYPPLNGDPLYLFMTHCPNVKHVTLPKGMDFARQESDWAYFSKALVNTNIWKLDSLSIGHPSQSIVPNNITRHYFECLYHVRESIKSFILTNGVITGSYSCLQNFQQLTSLTIREGVVHNIADCCGLLDYSPQVEEATIYFPTFNNEATAAAAACYNTYPKIHSMHLYGYNILSLNQREDMLYMERFSNLNNLYVCLPKTVGTAKIYDLVDKTVLDYIHRKIPSYKSHYTLDRMRMNCQYLDLYCNGMKNFRGGTLSNTTFLLNISSKYFFL